MSALREPFVPTTPPTPELVPYKKHRDSAYWQSVFQGSIVVLLLIGGIYWFFTDWYDKQHYVSVRWDGETIALSLSIDSPNRVTCVAYDSPNGEAIAELPKPIYLISSGKKTLTKPQMKRLVWRVDRTGKQTAAPAPGTPIWAMYERMDWSKERSKKRAAR